MGATDTLVKFIHKTELSEIPQEAIDITKKHIIDWFATAIAGSNEEAGTILHDYATEISRQCCFYQWFFRTPSRL